MLWIDMKSSTAAIIIAAAFVVGILGALVLRINERAATQLTTSPVAGDNDADGVTDEFDYAPNDPNR